MWQYGNENAGEDEEQQKKLRYGDTHHRAAASRFCCTLTHETGCNHCHLQPPHTNTHTHTSDPKYTPLPPSLFTPDTNLYSLAMALRAQRGLSLTLRGIPAVQLGSNPGGEQQNTNTIQGSSLATLQEVKLNMFPQSQSVICVIWNVSKNIMSFTNFGIAGLLYCIVGCFCYFVHLQVWRIILNFGFYLLGGWQLVSRKFVRSIDLLSNTGIFLLLGNFEVLSFNFIVCLIYLLSLFLHWATYSKY